MHERTSWARYRSTAPRWAPTLGLGAPLVALRGQRVLGKCLGCVSGSPYSYTTCTQHKITQQDLNNKQPTLLVAALHILIYHEHKPPSRPQNKQKTKLCRRCLVGRRHQLPLATFHLAIFFWGIWLRFGLLQAATGRFDCLASKMKIRWLVFFMGESSSLKARLVYLEACRGCLLW